MHPLHPVRLMHDQMERFSSKFWDRSPSVYVGCITFGLGAWFIHQFIMSALLITAIIILARHEGWRRGQRAAWGLENLRDGITLVRAISEIADNARRGHEPDPVITTDMSSALVLARLLEQEMPGIRAKTDEPMTIVMFDGVKINWSSAR
jgi:hypothetical protein